MSGLPYAIPITRGPESGRLSALNIPISTPTGLNTRPWSQVESHEHTPLLSLLGR